MKQHTYVTRVLISWTGLKNWTKTSWPSPRCNSWNRSAMHLVQTLILKAKLGSYSGNGGVLSTPTKGQKRCRVPTPGKQAKRSLAMGSVGHSASRPSGTGSDSSRPPLAPRTLNIPSASCLQIKRWILTGPQQTWQRCNMQLLWILGGFWGQGKCQKHKVSVISYLVSYLVPPCETCSIFITCHVWNFDCWFKHI